MDRGTSVYVLIPSTLHTRRQPWSERNERGDSFFAVQRSETESAVTGCLREIYVAFVLTPDDFFAKNAAVSASFFPSIEIAFRWCRCIVGMHISSSASAIAFQLTDDSARATFRQSSFSRVIVYLVFLKFSQRKSDLWTKGLQATRWSRVIRTTPIPRDKTICSSFRVS